MAHFAKLDENNIVLEVIVVSDADAPTEEAGQAFCRKLFKDETSVWKQTSYNTHGGVHVLGGTPLRKNFAGKGFTYDADKDAFIQPKEPDQQEWVLNETTCQYEAPIPMPETYIDGQTYNGEPVPDQYVWEDDVYRADNTQGWVKING
tara:strand:+ start:1250 stop:1693 length:444 start_codon:yes stop_codon:yes gene_type:complete